jgi:hypothetical protein
MRIERGIAFKLAVAFLVLAGCSCTELPIGYNSDAIPSSFRPSGDRDGQACNLAYHHINIPSNSCSYLPPSPRIAAQNVSVVLCSNAHLSGAGRVIFLDTSPQRRAMTRIYRAKMVGPEAFLLPITYCSTQLATASYVVTMPGTYSLELLQLYDQFSYDEITPMLPDFSLLPGTIPIEVTTPHKATAHTSCTAALCPLCPTADAPGRWLLHPKVAPILSTTCNPSPGTPQCHRSAAANNSGLYSAGEPVMRWQPYGCNLRPASDIAACRARVKRVCFVGDSQMRHLMNSFINPSFNLVADTGRAGADKSVAKHPAVRYRPCPLRPVHPHLVLTPFRVMRTHLSRVDVVVQSAV